jgi:hypothetical protein
MRWVSVLVALAALMSARHAHADCFDDAALYENVNPMLLRAIAWQESHNHAEATHTNNNGSVDYGVMQINSVHMPTLAQYGISISTLMQPCANVYIGAWHLRHQMNRYGNTWEAVGAYHSETPALRDQYSQRIYAILASWNQLGDSPAPLPSSFSSGTTGSIDANSTHRASHGKHSKSNSGVTIYRGDTLDTSRIHHPAVQ